MTFSWDNRVNQFALLAYATALVAGLPRSKLSSSDYASGKEILHVHVGKTAGASVEAFLVANRIGHTQVHVGSGAARVHRLLKWHKHVLVALRDPADRVVSAFNWRHTQGGGNVNRPRRTRAFENELYKCFPTVTSFAMSFVNGTGRCNDLAEESVEPTSASSYVHIGMGYRHYFGARVLALLERRVRSGEAKLYAVPTGPAILSKVLSMCARIGIPLRAPSLKHVNANYLRHAEIVESAEAMRALRQRLGFEYEVLDKLHTLAIESGPA
ncbi:hypothetical protein T492DRAFT_1000173 [Pavlovales sp. CCMP2436]|nr:hypothetical protein T492DRAFT_1000173 [Pavlovales sp. CCMP2436]